MPEALLSQHASRFDFLSEDSVYDQFLLVWRERSASKATPPPLDLLIPDVTTQKTWLLTKYILVDETELLPSFVVFSSEGKKLPR